MTPELRAGDVLDGRYRIVRLLGAGGMGFVYAAERLALGDHVAIKRLRPERDDPLSRVRFLREAKAAARIRHPNVVSVFDFGDRAGEPPYLVMELLEGRTLDEEIVAHGKLEAERALPIFGAVCGAIEAGHRRGVIHRDLKPANVMLARLDDVGETVKVLDFGLAAMLDGTDGPGLTKRGTLLGSMSYMAPEQLAGDPADERTDVFALGVMLYEMLTGALPFSSAGPIERIGEILRRAHDRVDELAPSTPSGVVDAIERALAFAPSDRHASVEDFAREAGTSLAPPAPPRPRTDLATTTDSGIGLRGELTLVTPPSAEQNDLSSDVRDGALDETALAAPAVAVAQAVPAGVGLLPTERPRRAPTPTTPLSDTRSGSSPGTPHLLGDAERDIATERPPGAIRASFVGRAVELEHLQGAWAPNRQSTGRAAVLVGEPGSGKTRTLAELRTVLGADGADTVELDQRASVDSIADDLEQRGESLVVTMDDVTETDADALVAIDRWAQRVRDAGGLFVLALATPTHDQTLLSRWLDEVESSRAWAVVRLGPLSSDEVRLWLTESFPGARFTGSDAREVVRVTGGWPRALMDVATDLVQTERVVDRGGRWVRFALNDLEIPASVRVQTRQLLTRVGEPLRRLLEVCAVLGDEATIESASMVAGIERDEVESFVDEAVSRGSLVTEVRGASVAIRFVDRPLRELLRAELDRERRLELGRAAVEAIELAHAANTRPAALALAEHLVELGELRHALGQALDAAEDALFGFRHDDAALALRLARKALDAMRAGEGAVTPAEAARFDRLMGALDTRRGRYEEACEQLRRATANATDAGDTMLRVDALLDLADAHLGSGDHQLAISSATAALEAARSEGDKFRVLTARAQLAGYLLRQGRMDEAATSLIDVLQHTERFGLLRLHARALRDLAWIRIKQGHFGEGEARAREALDVARASEDRIAERSSVSALAAALAEAGDSASALPFQRQALDISRALGLRRMEAIDLANLGEAHLDLHDSVAALEHFREALDIFVEMGDRACEGDCRVNVGRALLASGQRLEAVAMLDRGREICESTGRKEYAGIALLELGEAHLAEGGAADALSAFTDAAEHLAPMTSHLGWKADLGLARALAALGRNDEATDHARRALDVLESRRGQHASGMDERAYERLLDEARALLTSLGGASGAP